MKVRGAVRGRIKLCLVFALVLCLAGCAAQQEGETLQTLRMPSGPHTSALTDTEKNILLETGQVDKNVPEHAIEDVAREYRNYLRKGRPTVCAFSQQSEKYLAYARSVFRSRGMPEELANLAIVESGYRPEAKSAAGAAGAWQFMPATGRNYGLAQDWWQDERLDPWHATEAAADYLQKLYNDFGDWPTAIAAYNAGEGKIARAKDGTGGKDFFEVNKRNHLLDDKARLKEETQNYVPRFLAVTKIMRKLPELGFDAIDPEHARPVLRYTAEPGTDLKALSMACNLAWADFTKYNPHHKRTITCTDKKTFVYVPASVEKEAARYLCNNDKVTFAGWQPTRIATSRDSLEQISKRANVSLAALKAANPGVSRLRAGETLILPPGVNMLAAAISPKKSASAQIRNLPASAGGRSHQIKSGETLYSVAQKYGVAMASLKAANGITDPSRIKVGQKLVIPAKAVAEGGSSGKIGKRTASYTVRPKDNLWQIARKHNVSVEDLKRWNGITEKALVPGTTLVVAQD